MSAPRDKAGRYLCEECPPLPPMEAANDSAPPSPARAILHLFRQMGKPGAATSAAGAEKGPRQAQRDK